MDAVETLLILVRLFNYDDEYRCFENWLDKAAVQDFYQGREQIYRECKGLFMNPDNENKAGLFLKYTADLLSRGTELRLLQIFFPAVIPKESRTVLRYLNDIAGRDHEGALWQLINTVAESAACFPEAELLPRECFRSYNCGAVTRVSFYLLERYLGSIQADRENLILLSAYICTVFENQNFDSPKQLLWLFNCTRFAEYCGPNINEPLFLKDLLAAASDLVSFSVTKYTWINYVVTVWILNNHRDRSPNPLWPVRAGEKLQQEFDDARSENPLYTAAAMLTEMQSGGMHEALVMRYLKTNKKFDFSDFILNLDNADTIRMLPKEVFDRYHITQTEAILRYRERHGDTFEKAARIMSCIRGRGSE
jgi:hypothetical protein